MRSLTEAPRKETKDDEVVENEQTREGSYEVVVRHGAARAPPRAAAPKRKKRRP